MSLPFNTEDVGWSRRTDDYQAVRDQAGPSGRDALIQPMGVAGTVLADLCALGLAFETARYLRLQLGGVLFAPVTPDALDAVMPPFWILAIVWLGSAWWARTYRPRRGLWWPHAVVQVVETTVMALALTVVLWFALYVQSAPALSRSFLLLVGLCGGILSLVLRAGLRAGGRRLFRRRPLNVLVVGDGGRETEEMVSALEAAGADEVSVRGLLSTDPADRAPHIPLLGTVRDLRRAINDTRADRVVISETHTPPEVLAECVDVCTSMYVPLNCTGGGLTRVATVVDAGDLAGVRLFEVRRPEFERTRDVVKRATDVLAASAGLVLLLPLGFALAIAIRATSPGPILFVADRVGRGGKHFSCFKFRSMVVGADDPDSKLRLDGHIFKDREDTRITPIGRFMRRFSLDEIPQLYSVLLGDMSLVGPRPLPATDLDPDGLSERHPTWAVERSTVRPGITGLWQVRGRSQLPFAEMERLDLLYVRTRSVQLDLQILIETVPAVISGRGAV